jgi:anti-sigma regulatory factor (Ser/Thr protein kinase)
MSVVAGLWSEVEAHTDHALLVVRGGLSLSTVPRVRRPLRKLLHDRGAVVVDLTGLHLAWGPAAEVFPAALSAAGGWPAARLVLTGASDELERQLRAQRIPHTVPLVVDPADAPAQLRRRPERVTRRRDLPVTDAAPAAARALVREACADWSAATALDAAEVVANELVSNAVRHARTSCRLSVTIDPAGLHIGVRDYAPAHSSRPRPVDATQVHGRGMHLVAVLATTWGVQEHTDGKTTWAVLSLPS